MSVQDILDIIINGEGPWTSLEKKARESRMVDSDIVRGVRVKSMDWNDGVFSAALLEFPDKTSKWFINKGPNTPLTCRLSSGEEGTSQLHMGEYRLRELHLSGCTFDLEYLPLQARYIETIESLASNAPSSPPPQAVKRESVELTPGEEKVVRMIPRYSSDTADAFAFAMKNKKSPHKEKGTIYPLKVEDNDTIVARVGLIDVRIRVSDLNREIGRRTGVNGVIYPYVTYERVQEKEGEKEMSEKTAFERFEELSRMKSPIATGFFVPESLSRELIVEANKFSQAVEGIKRELEAVGEMHKENKRSIDVLYAQLMKANRDLLGRKVVLDIEQIEGREVERIMNEDLEEFRTGGKGYKDPVGSKENKGGRVEREREIGEDRGKKEGKGVKECGEGSTTKPQQDSQQSTHSSNDNEPRIKDKDWVCLGHSHVDPVMPGFTPVTIFYYVKNDRTRVIVQGNVGRVSGTPFVLGEGEVRRHSKDIPNFRIGFREALAKAKLWAYANSDRLMGGKAHPVIDKQWVGFQSALSGFLSAIEEDEYPLPSTEQWNEIYQRYSDWDDATDTMEVWDTQKLAMRGFFEQVMIKDGCSEPIECNHA